MSTKTATGCDFPFTVMGRESFPEERLAGALLDPLAGVDPARRGGGHQPRGQVHVVAEAYEGASHGVPVGTASEVAAGDPDLDLPGGGRLLKVTEFEGRRGSAGRVVLVGDR